MFCLTFCLFLISWKTDATKLIWRLQCVAHITCAWKAHLRDKALGVNVFFLVVQLLLSSCLLLLLVSLLLLFILLLTFLHSTQTKPWMLVNAWTKYFTIQCHTSTAEAKEATWNQNRTAHFILMRVSFGQMMLHGHKQKPSIIPETKTLMWHPLVRQKSTVMTFTVSFWMHSMNGIKDKDIRRSSYFLPKYPWSSYFHVNDPLPRDRPSLKGLLQTKWSDTHWHGNTNISGVKMVLIERLFFIGGSTGHW